MLDEGAYKTLSLLELTGPAPLTATHRRSVATLTGLADRGFVELYGSAQEKTMAITDAGRKELVLHRVLMSAAKAELGMTEEVEAVSTKDHRIVEADDVTEEILEQVKGIVEGWYDDMSIDWEDVWDRMEKRVLNDGRGIDMGEDLGSPAIKKIKREIWKWRAQG
jgi:DNA-binding PadR family transcriptional regulator